MITDILDYDDGQNLRGDVIVIGSGIAGSEVSTFLARKGKKVILIESGREQFDPKIQSLNDVIFTGKRHRELNPHSYYHQYLPPKLRGVSRVRQFGGTSNVWTGKWKYLQSSDFEGRDWVPNSGWPISFSDLIDHYRSAAKDYGFGDLELENERKEIADLRNRLQANGLKMASFYWESQPTRTARKFGQEMRESDRLQVILGATVTELRLNSALTKVTEAKCKSLEGREISVSGRVFVLATGAFEAARILLASDQQIPGGIGNSHDLVGRFYTDHPKHHTGILYPGTLTRNFANEFQYRPKPRFGICFALDDETQKKYKLLEHVLYLKPIYMSVKERFLKKLQGRSGYFRDQNGFVKSYRVKFVSEQVPHKESRVNLGDEFDALGQRKLEVAWRFTQQDMYSINMAIKLLSERIEKAGLGTFDFGEKPPRLENMTDAAHQMGTTRMADSPKKGVVDINCKVFGTENIFVASSAVFPTGPSYSPTYTILALSRRLGRHLLNFAVHN